MNLRETYNAIANFWLNGHNLDSWWQEGTDHLISLLPRDPYVLDVGCGAGVKAKYLTNHGCKVLGVDFAENMIELAKKEAPKAKFRVLDAYGVESLSEEFDCVFAQAMLLHVPKSRVIEILQKFKNILKTNGFLYIAVKEVKEDGLEEKVVKDSDVGFEYERFFSFFRMSELENYFKRLGLEVVWSDSKRSGRSVWLQIIGRKI